MMFTLTLTNRIENTNTTYYASRWETICDYRRQLESELADWTKDKDFTLEYGDDIEIDSDDLELVQPGIYTDAE